MTERLFLLDGTALVYRAFFALQRTGLTNLKGEPTGAVLGFANTLQMLLAAEKPEYLAVVFDPPGPTFRHETYPEYKANRSRMPDELRMQIPWVKELVEAWPAALLEVSGMEADDVIGSYARQLAGPDLHVVAVSSDKDFYQLLDYNIHILNPGRGGTSAIETRLIGPDNISEKFGVQEPGQVIDVLALMGDTSDNVPGLPGVGPKTAGKLISEYGSIEGLYRHLEDLKPALRTKLETHRDLLMQSRDLVTIRTELDLPTPLEDLRTHSPGTPELVQLLERMNFQRMIRDLGLEPAVEPPAELFSRQDSYRLISDASSLADLVSRCSEAEGGFAVDTETTSVDPMRADLVGIALALGPEDAYYVNVGHRDGPEPIPLDIVREYLGPLLRNPDLPKVAHHAKYDLLVLERAGLPVEGLTFDTMIASYLLDPEGSHKLDTLAREKLGEVMIPLTDLIGKGAKQRSMADVEAGAAARYAAEDADMTLRLSERFGPRLEQLGLDALFRDVELPLMHVLRRMEKNGVALDVGFLEQMSLRLTEELDRLQGRCYELAGKEFNINSPQQLGNVLFEDLQLPRGKRTKTGYSTDVEVLQMLKPLHDLPATVLEYRQIAKLKSTYVDALPLLIHPDTGRIHASFNQTVAATGRLSSSDPNLQNIPIRTPLGKEVRKAFVPGEEGWVLLSADYSQIELRIMAHLSGDPGLLEAFARDEDVHRETAARVFGVPVGEVTETQRGQAKTVNFGVLYGQGPFGLARTLGISTEEAGEFIKNYKAQYVGVVTYLEQTLAEAKRNGFVTTLLNRRRYLPGLTARSAAARSAAERLAINTPIQGSAADLIKVAMVRLDCLLGTGGRRARLLMQVHDELVLECPANEAESLRDEVKEIMEGAIELKVPVVVNIGVGAHWAEIH